MIPERRRHSAPRAFPAALVAAALAAGVGMSAASVRSGDRDAFALTGARVIAAPNRIFDPGVVVIRGGVIEAAGRDGAVAIPADARVHDLRGKVVHAGFIDPHVAASRLEGRRARTPSDEEEPEERPTPPARVTRGPADHPLTAVRADERVLDTLTVRDRVAETYRRMGFAVVGAVPDAGTLRGRGTVVSLAEGPMTSRVIEPESGQYVALEPEPFDFSQFGRAPYPVSRMGTVALVRQEFLDAAWWRQASTRYAAQPAGRARPRFQTSTPALGPASEGKETVVFETADVLGLLRAGKIARELKLKARYVGAGDEYRLRDQVVALRPDLVLRVDFPRPDRLRDESEWLDVSLERLRAIDRAPSNPKWLKDSGLAFSFTTDGLEDSEDFPRRVREALARGLSREDALAAVTTIPARQLGLGDRLGAIEAGKIANLVVATGDPFAAATRVTDIWIDGKRYTVPERRPGGIGGPQDPPPGLSASQGQADERDLTAARGAETDPKPDVRPFPARDDGPVSAPPAVVVRGATVWTQGPAGIIEGADLVVSGGKVTAVGRGAAVPAGAVSIDGRGRHVTPGLIDAHSHTAIDGQVNEGTHAITAEVRIKDVLDPFDVAIYRELAGGLTAANVLHGSANAIGGQNATVKWRRGGGPDDLLVATAPEGIKFALGENPKRSNVQVPSVRYPQTRMGVANQIRERFLAARDYRRRQAEHRQAASRRGAAVLPPAPDLQLEAIAEILEGKRKIHCHSYRKDEILEMIRTAEEFGVKIATFQHVLEGYKVADEIARHGAGASLFTDWWAYKFEVYDAIPYAGPLLHERGVLTSFNSDSDELARRLNWEAAKAVKYGGVPPAEALAFVTSNAAKQLGIFDRTGSLEPGKDGDFVLWSGDPLSSGSIALQTWIEGKQYFDREHDVARRPALAKERAELVARTKRVAEEERRSAAERAREEAPEERRPEKPEPPPAVTRAPEEPEKPPEPLRPPAAATPAVPAPTPTPPPAGGLR
ncbi:MAG: amidohydrolase family protein [Thermoanaerobaculia bacterium]